MLAAQKNNAATFLDAALAFLRGGWGDAPVRYAFADDPLPASNSSAPFPVKLPANDSLAGLAGEVRGCRACGLCRSRKNSVPGEGVEQPLVMVIGEGPGGEEDATGRPFVGRAGQLLDKMLVAIGLSRNENCFIANMVKCRPPHNRDPLPEESAACAPFLLRQMALLRPKALLGMGKIASQFLLKTNEGITRIRGRVVRYNDCPACSDLPLMPTFHPSYLLRNEGEKRFAWEDLQNLCVLLAKLDAAYAEKPVVQAILRKRGVAS